MIVDIHTHIFPPDFIRRRGHLAKGDAVFAEMYGPAEARMATAEHLLESMATAGVDVSVACGFWWADPAIAGDHAAYLVEAAAASGGRILPFVPTAPAMAPAGAAGIGEVRTSDPLSMEATDLPLLVHGREAIGHGYPGKEGGLDAGGLWALLAAQPQARVIAAHWGGGFPFFGLMPEVRALIAADRIVVDTAASAYLYDPAVFEIGLRLMGREAVCWGSDFPLRPQELDRLAVEEAVTDEGDRAAVLGGNAARFLRLEARSMAVRRPDRPRR